MPAPTRNDADLVAESLRGNREAFGQIVTRYQSLVCSLAYSATGSLSQSEDLAQETFVTAWKQLAGLREREKLRAWLCGIARNLINSALRRQGREPAHGAEPLDLVEEAPSSEATPPERAISREEEAILWRSIGNIPETYREPMILFYREQQSVERVAAALELSEEAVHQRLSRGRKLLQEEVLAFVEGALGKTSPGQAFTLAVLAALPFSLASSAKAATVAVAAAKGGATATGATFASVLGVLAGPLIGVVGGYLGLRASLKSTRTPRERKSMFRYNLRIIAAAIIFTASLLLFIFLGSPLWKTHPALYITLGFAITLAYGGFIFVTAWRFGHAFTQMRGEERERHPEAFDRPDTGMFCTPWEYRSRATFFGLPLIHCRAGKLPGQKKVQPAIGWIAFGEVAYGILFANGAFAVGGISVGGASVGIFSFGGFSLGAVAFGGFAIGSLALGGAAIGLLASGGLAVAWHAATGGVAAAHEIALGGAALAKHANDSVARDFYLRHYWLNIDQPGPRNLFWIVCFAPVIFQMLGWKWLQKKFSHRKRHL